MNHVKPKRRNRAIILIAIGIIVLSASVLGVYRYNRPIPALSVTIAAPSITAQAVSLPFTQSGESAIATSANKQLGQGTNANKVVPIASIAKLVTILTVLNKYPLEAGQTGPTITLSSSDEERYDYYNSLDGSTVKVANGEQITEYQMLQAMLIPSGDNVADSLATWAFGSLSAYRTAAQDEVNHLGMGSTTIGSDASGFLADTTSTANDLVLLGEAAQKHSVITEIAAQRTTNLPVAGTVYTTNMALGLSDVTGLKTGTSDQAGNCFLFSATHTFGNKQTETFIGVVLRSPTQQNRFTEAEALLDATYAGYKDVTVARAGQPLGTVKSAWGATTGIAPAADVSEFVWSGDKEATKTSISVSDKASLADNQQIGTIAAGSDSTPLVTTSKLGGPSLWWRIFH